MPSITYERFENGLDLRLDKRATDSNRMAVLDNAHVTTGRKLRGRPGVVKVAQLETGTKGLVAGATKMQTFYSSGVISHANTLFQANHIPSASGADLAQVTVGFVFSGFVYVAARYADASVEHHYLDGTVPPRITDPNCPNEESAVKMVEKVFGTANDIVRYSATGNARDWTTADDAGFMPTGLQAEGDPQALALSQFRKQLAVMMIDSTQIWDVDPDPALITIADNVFGVGTRFKRSPVRMAGDTFFLSEQGYRSITVAVFAENLQDVDVGTPIDDLVADTITDDLDPLSVFSQKFGQFWSITGNYAWVYTVSRTSKITAWSRYTFPFTIDAACAFKGNMYLRSGDDVYRVDRNAHTDDGTPIPIRIEMPYVDMKLPGVEKMITGVDAVIKGSAMIQFRYNPSSEELITSEVPLSEDTNQGAMTAVEVQAVKIAPVITHQADELFELELLTVYYEPMVAT